MPEEQEKNIERNPDGTYKKGVSGNPGGRPKGESITTVIRRKLKENPERLEELAEFFLTDRRMRDLLWKMLDGQPKQNIEMGLDDNLDKIEVNIVNNATSSDKRISEESSSTTEKDQTDS